MSRKKPKKCTSCGSSKVTMNERGDIGCEKCPFVNLSLNNLGRKK